MSEILKPVGPNVTSTTPISAENTANYIAERDRLRKAEEDLRLGDRAQKVTDGYAQIKAYLTAKYGLTEEVIKNIAANDPKKRAQIQAEENSLKKKLEEDIIAGRPFSLGGSLSPVFLIGALILFMWISK